MHGLSPENGEWEGCEEDDSQVLLVMDSLEGVIGWTRADNYDWSPRCNDCNDGKGAVH